MSTKEIQRRSAPKSARRARLSKDVPVTTVTTEVMQVLRHMVDVAAGPNATFAERESALLVLAKEIAQQALKGDKP